MLVYNQSCKYKMIPMCKTLLKRDMGRNLSIFQFLRCSFHFSLILQEVCYKHFYTFITFFPLTADALFHWKALSLFCTSMLTSVHFSQFLTYPLLKFASIECTAKIMSRQNCIEHPAWWWGQQSLQVPQSPSCEIFHSRSIFQLQEFAVFWNKSNLLLPQHRSWLSGELRTPVTCWWKATDATRHYYMRRQKIAALHRKRECYSLQTSAHILGKDTLTPSLHSIGILLPSRWNKTKHRIRNCDHQGGGYTYMILDIKVHALYKILKTESLSSSTRAFDGSQQSSEL